MNSDLPDSEVFPHKPTLFFRDKICLWSMLSLNCRRVWVLGVQSRGTISSCSVTPGSETQLSDQCLSSLGKTKQIPANEWHVWNSCKEACCQRLVTVLFRVMAGRNEGKGARNYIPVLINVDSVTASQNWTDLRKEYDIWVVILTVPSFRTLMAQVTLWY